MATQSNFDFLKPEWPELFEAAREAEKQVRTAPRSCLFSCRYALEYTVKWLYVHDDYLKRPYNDNLGALIHERTFRDNMPPELFPKVKIIHSNGNLAAHSTKKLSPLDALQTLKELFHFLYWFYRSYSAAEPVDHVFSIQALPHVGEGEKDKTLKEIQARQADLAERERRLKEAEAARLDTEAKLEAAQQELARVQAEVQAAKSRNEEKPDTHDYSEAETRKYIIDLLLREAGWDPAGDNVTEVKVEGMPSKSGKGYADYVLWGDDRKPLAVIEAKRTSVDADKGKQQAKIYADRLEEEHGQRPVIFYTNGYETTLWDDTAYPPRAVQGFYKKDELVRLINRRSIPKDTLKNQDINTDITNRPYQTECIRRITEHLEDRFRKALAVMATGTGKTRTAISLTDILQRAGWAKRILFLADRNALVRQAKNAFLQHLPDSNPVDIRDDKANGQTARVVLSTYPSMIGVIDDLENGVRRFGVGHFDLVIIDEAHRSVYQKYRAIFEYFDSLLLGLTATPRNEVDRNTYELFELEDGVPTYFYELDQAVKDGYLTPPRCMSVPLKFMRKGVKYDELSATDKEQYEETIWEGREDGIKEIDKKELNRWLYNQDTVDKVLKHLLTHGIHVEGGDRLGKTIIFAANHEHAKFITERYDANFPKQAGHFTRIIDSHETMPETLLDAFSQKDEAPHIAVSVDMLDTGVDVPEVLNLVFFKRVYSKVKFNQMIGRGTRLCENLFGPEDHKKEFVIFDFCENFEFFDEHPDGYEGSATPPLHQVIFGKRLEVLTTLGKRDDRTDEENKFLGTMRDHLCAVVTGMNPDNFLVRPSRQYVERYADRAKWDNLTPDDELDLINTLSGLPSDLDEGNELCRRFDNLILDTQLAHLRGDTAFNVLKGDLQGLAKAIAEKFTIPMVAAQLTLLEAMQTDEFWETPSCGLLEHIRIKLRDLVQFIEKAKKKTVYTNLEDKMDEGKEVDLPGSGGVSLPQYRLKVEQFIRSKQDHITISKLRMNQPLTKLDLEELERMLFSAEEVISREQFHKAYGDKLPLGEFIRNLVGLDRSAAKAAFSEFLNTETYSATQIHFVNQIIDYLTRNGVMEPKALFEAPFTDAHTHGVAGVFPIEEEVKKVVERLREVNRNAVAQQVITNCHFTRTRHVLWTSEKKYMPHPFAKEADLEKTILEVEADLFGPKRIYLDPKKKIGTKGGTNNIPDGYLIDLTSAKTPQLFVVENELAKHDPLKHIAVQILEFSLSFESSPGKVKAIVKEALNKRKEGWKQCEEYAKANGFENVDYLLETMIFNQDAFRALVIIDECVDELETVLVSRFKFPVEILTLERYAAGKAQAYRFTPFLDDLTEDTQSAGLPPLDPSELDTIVVPAHEEGFVETVLGENRWYAVRLHTSMIPKIKNIAFYRTAPISAITHTAQVERIEPWKDTGKYALYFTGEAKELDSPIPLVPRGHVKAPQSLRYTAMERLEGAKNLDGVFQWRAQTGPTAKTPAPESASWSKKSSADSATRRTWKKARFSWC